MGQNLDKPDEARIPRFIGGSVNSSAQSYQEISEFWDEHSLSDYWDQTQPAEFSIELSSNEVYYRLELALVEQIRTVAQRQGVSPETLLNLWIQEKLDQSV